MKEQDLFPIELRNSVLIVDDEDGPRESLKLILESRYDVFTALDAQQACEFLQNRSVDLITLDLRMPGTPGHQVLGDFRRLSPASDILIISGWGTLDAAIEAMRHGVSDFITKPFGMIEVLSTVERIFAKRQVPTISLANLPANVDLLQFARVLASTLDGQDCYTHGHCERVARYSLYLAEEFGFSPQDSHDLVLGAYLHDIGKLGIDRQIIRKQGGLSASEKAILRSHPQRGLRVVDPLQLSPMARSVIRHHHECWDGSGYPDGLYGDQISLAARIVRVADAYDAMTSNRPYRTALAAQHAIDELKKGRLTEFDPDVVDAFIGKLCYDHPPLAAVS